MLLNVMLVFPVYFFCFNSIFCKSHAINSFITWILTIVLASYLMQSRKARRRVWEEIQQLATVQPFDIWQKEHLCRQEEKKLFCHHHWWNQSNQAQQGWAECLWASYWPQFLHPLLHPLRKRTHRFSDMMAIWRSLAVFPFFCLDFTTTYQVLFPSSVLFCIRFICISEKNFIPQDC